MLLTVKLDGKEVTRLYWKYKVLWYSRGFRDYVLFYRGKELGGEKQGRETM